MTLRSALVAALLSLPFASVAQAAPCPNCSFEFPSSWRSEEHPWGMRVWVEEHQVDVKVQQDDQLHPLGPGDVADELVWLEAEVGENGGGLTSKNGRIVQTVSREPAVVLDYAWAVEAGGGGKGVRLVRRCGVRLIFEQQGDAIRLDSLLQVSDRVRYTRSECTKLNADVIPLEVLEGLDKVQVPDMGSVIPEAPSPDEVRTPAPEESAAAAVEPTVAPTPVSDEGGFGTSTLLLLLGLLGLVVLIVLMLRSGRSEPLEGLPPLEDPALIGPDGARTTGSFPRNTGSFPRNTGSFPRDTGSFPRDGSPLPRDTGAFARGEARSTGSFARNTGSFQRDRRVGDAAPPDGVQDQEHPSGDDFGDENTDAILPAGTYGLRGAGGGERAEAVPAVGPDDLDGRDHDDPMAVHVVPASRPGGARRDDPEDGSGPISVPTHAVVSYPSVPSASAGLGEGGDDPQYDEDDVVRISPVESVLASLGITTWLDFTAPGVGGVNYLPSTVAGLLAVQNGGRFGYGWLLLLGLRRKNMDLMTLNGEARVKQRFGEGWLVGVFAFGNVLWVDPDQRWYIRTLAGERHLLGDSAEVALRRLAEEPELRDLGAPRDLVERCRSAVGELLPGWVYRHRGETSVIPEDAYQDRHFEPVEIVPFLELLG